MASPNQPTRPPAFSVVIPAYNAQDYLGAAIESVLNQTLPPLEIIVIDDGSTDDTRERLRIYEGRIRYYRQKNQGIGASRNFGISFAKGDWIALLDADDVWHPRKLECQSAVIVRNPTAILVGTEQVVIDRTGTVIAGKWAESVSLATESIPLRRVLEAAMFCPSSVVMHQMCAKLSGGFSTQVPGSEDMLMWWTIAAKGPVLRIQTALTGYRIHPESISHKYTTMVASKKRALEIASTLLSPLQTQRRLRCLARARVYCESSWELHSGGDHWGAINDICISMINHPWAQYSSAGTKLRWNRAKRLCRYVLSALPKFGHR